ncbi:MAG: (d)CMP kinase [Lachnospiraceae bacterium]|nr:(d)CMP kinase [Lachnospiraceae bacterium]
MKTYNIAIDGPAGAGKSTIARLAAKELGFVYVDTGAMYRALALFFLRKGISPEDISGIRAALPEAEVTLHYEGGEQVVLLNGENVNGLIRTEEVGKMASVTSPVPAVREKLRELQWKLAREADVIMDGRDIGTEVLPDADLKIYLTADVSIRAERRYRELVERGETCDRDELEREIAERDRQDMSRAVSPLKRADDAVLLDGSLLTIEQTRDEILRLFRERREKTGDARQA